MKKICFLMGSRADACPLRFVIRALEKYEYAKIHRIETHGLYGNEAHVYAELQRVCPDMIVCLGDRIETLLACAIATSMAVPIVHIHGGEDTYGSTDQLNRYAISALSSFHFVSHGKYAKRLIKMGEAPESVFVCGAPGVDAIADPRMTREEIESELGVELKNPIALVCYHPETLGNDDENWLEIKNELSKYRTIIISGANEDIGGNAINRKWIECGLPICYVKSFPQKLWLSLMHEADVLIGNSSGFIFEGMTLGKKIIMIGERQKGRYEDALEFFPTANEGWEDDAVNFYPYGIPGTVGPMIAKKIMELGVPDKPRKILYG